MDPKELGQSIRQARLARKLEVSEAAREAGVSVAQWHKIEGGRGGEPRVSTRRKMLAAVGLDEEPAMGSPALDGQVLDQILETLADLAKEVHALAAKMEAPPPARPSGRRRA